MSPQFDNDPSAAQSILQVYPKGVYEFETGEKMTAFSATSSEGKVNYGVRCKITCKEVYEGDESMKNRTGMLTFYQHSDGAKNMSKGFQMVISGFPRTAQGEQEFNQHAAGGDWRGDPDTGEVGDNWVQLASKRFVAACSAGEPFREGGDPSQNWDALYSLQQWADNVAAASE